MPGSPIQTKAAAEVTRRTLQLLVSLRLRASALKIVRAKIGPKSVRFDECEFFSPVTSATYNFNTLKCPNFRVGTSRRDARFAPQKRDKMRQSPILKKLTPCARGTCDASPAACLILDSCVSLRLCGHS